MCVSIGRHFAGGREREVKAGDPFSVEVPVPELEPREAIAFDFGDPDNQLLLECFVLVCDQLLVGAGGPFALNLCVLPLVFEAHGVTDPFDKRWLMGDLKAITAGYLEGSINNERKAR